MRLGWEPETFSWSIVIRQCISTVRQLVFALCEGAPHQPLMCYAKQHLAGNLVNVDSNSQSLSLASEEFQKHL